MVHTIWFWARGAWTQEFDLFLYCVLVCFIHSEKILKECMTVGGRRVSLAHDDSKFSWARFRADDDGYIHKYNTCFLKLARKLPRLSSYCTYLVHGANHTRGTREGGKIKRKVYYAWRPSSRSQTDISPNLDWYQSKQTTRTDISLGNSWTGSTIAPRPKNAPYATKKAK